MKNFPFLFLVLLTQIPTILLIIENPIFLINAKNPFVLSTDDEFYYVITKGFNLKINKESEHKVTSENSFNYFYLVNFIKENIYMIQKIIFILNIILLSLMFQLQFMQNLNMVHQK